MEKTKKKLLILILSICVIVAMTGCGSSSTDSSSDSGSTSKTTTSQSATSSSSNASSIGSVPKYSGDASITINGNVPKFTKKQLAATKSYEKYGKLDSLGRATTCIACIDKDIMPTTKRGSIGMIKPTGWHLVKYDFVDGKYLYNRCHLIAYCLTGIDGSSPYLAQNLVTGTRYMNIDGQLPYEEKTADYIKETGNHVLYRVTPIFKGDNLLCSGVHMEAQSIEDNGEGIKFNVYCYNVQPKVTIDYATGDNHLSSDSTAASSSSSSSGTSASSSSTSTSSTGKNTYVINTNTKKFHKPSCESAKQTLAKNKKTVHETRAQLIKEGYSPCKICNP